MEDLKCENFYLLGNIFTKLFNHGGDNKISLEIINIIICLLNNEIIKKEDITYGYNYLK